MPFAIAHTITFTHERTRAREIDRWRTTTMYRIAKAFHFVRMSSDKLLTSRHSPVLALSLSRPFAWEMLNWTGVSII